MGTIDERDRIPPAIRRALQGLTRSIRVWLAIDAAAWVAVATTVIVFGSLGIDRLLRLDRPQRAILLAVYLGALGALVWRRLVRPLRRTLDARMLAATIEGRSPDLNGRLLAAVEFAAEPEAQRLGYSGVMMREAVAAGAAAVERARVPDLTDVARRRRNAAVAGLALALLVVVSAAWPDTMRLWFLRNVGLSERRWPQRTTLIVRGLVNGAVPAVRGDDLVLEVEADPKKVIPAYVTVTHRAPGKRGRSEPLSQFGAHLFRMTFRNVLDPFVLQVKGGDAVTEWIPVRLAERPIVTALELWTVDPEYAGGDRRALDVAAGRHAVAAGSRLDLAGASSKPLAGGTLHTGKATVGEFRAGSGSTFTVAVGGDKLVDGEYTLTLTDRDGLESRPPTRFSMRLIPDRKPAVRARLNGIGDMITPAASIGVEGVAEDDYGVRAVTFVRTVPEPGSRHPIHQSPEPRGRKDVSFLFRQEAAPFQPKVGEYVVFHVEAADNNTVSGPSVGASATFSLLVVTPDDLRKELLRREQEQRTDFERAVRDQRGLGQSAEALRVLAAEARLPADAEAVTRLEDLERSQRLMGPRCRGIAEQFRQILLEAENNRLDQEAGADATLRQRLQEQIVAPLLALADRDVPAAADALEEVRKRKTPDECVAGLEEAMKRQRRALIAMEEILKVMLKWEGYQETVRLLGEIIEGQDNVIKATGQEQEKRTESLFDD